MATASRPLAIVTGASSGIGLELAKLCVRNGFDVLIAADEPQIEAAAAELRQLGGSAEAVQADLATLEGVDRLYAAAAGRPVSALLANAGRGLGRAFLDQDFEKVRRVIDTNVTGTLYLIQLVGRDMQARGQGRIMITGSIAGVMPGTFNAVYNGTKALLDSFAVALRHELKDSGVSVTCLMPGPTETEFFERADLLDTKVATDKKQPADEVARIGFNAMMKGEAQVIAGLKNKLEAAVAHVTPNSVLAEMHRKLTEPGTAAKR
jgi:short-subunit dehydrogenase